MTKKDARKMYEKPDFTKLTPEQTILKLFGLAMVHHEGAKDLLEILYVKKEISGPANEPEIRKSAG